MCQNLYLNRTLFSDNQRFSETELLNASNYIVILAEPGAGKTELMKSLATQLGSKEITASVFSYMRTNSEGTPLVIDAFDELAKVDATGIHKLLANVSNARPTHVIISSRSSEWDNSATSTFEQFVGHAPTVARLCEFDESEQREIYTHHTKKDSFIEFQAEVTRFSLEPLLPNPQFLKLFADAYIESEGHFSDKRSIFTQAITSLAREVNANTKPTPSLSSDQKINLSSEIFAKLLLSGAEGIRISEANENRMYPLVGSLLRSSSVNISSILATRLFKPGDNADQHRPVHKIVAEYCAADYLTKRIASPSDPLTIAQCLPIIAPNSTVRDELRGLIGWMAALGSKSIEETAIELDPYAVLANGDPSQLAESSKAILLSRLKEVEAVDPYFRRSDSWRRFSVAGLFTQDVMEVVKPIIADGGDGDLRDLLLELLVGTQAVRWLVIELRQLLLSPTESKQTRILAYKCLNGLESYDPRLDLSDLIVEASSSSLSIAANVIESIDIGSFISNELEVFFRNCANLYPSHKQDFDGVLGDRYFVKRFISCLNVLQLEGLLDLLSKGLACNCGKKAYECECRTGLSKIIGSLLDHYFELAKPPFEPLRIWQWVEHLNFPGQINTQDIKSVQVLRADDALRQGIISHIFGKLTKREEIFQASVHKFGGHYSHGGLCLSLDDHRFIIDLAFESNNTQLWASFLAKHQFNRFSNKKGPDSLRSQMRKQASQKPGFMRRWAQINRQESILAKEEDQKWNVKHRRLMRRRSNKKKRVNEENIQFVQAERAQVEAGQHWGCLVRFAELVLNKPENIELEFGDVALVRNAIRNCLDFVSPLIPDLQKLADLQCESKGLVAETILYAACIEIMRDRGSLEGVEHSLLFALRTNLNMGYHAVSQDESNSLKKEVDRLIFPDVKSAEKFLLDYVEPQLVQNKCAHPEVGLLEYDEIFSPLQAKLPIEWLERFDKLEPFALNTLFELTAQYGDRERLNSIIELRCGQFLFGQSEPNKDEHLEQRRKFWFVRAFYFLSLEQAEPYWNWLTGDKNSILLLNERSSRMNRSDHPYWPVLTSHKVSAILQAFFEQWPKVQLPSNWGTGSPDGETAYRFLKDIIWSIGNDSPDEAIPVLHQLLAEPHFADIHIPLKSIQAEQLRKKALRDFEPPTSTKIVDLLDNNAVVTVEGLRQLIILKLISYQKAIDGGEFNAANRFYTKNTNGDYIRLGEVESVEIIAERLDLLLSPQSIVITSEHQIKNQNRIDITAAKAIDGIRRLLVIEAKGQWHPDLYSAATTQLYERYSVHPDAEQQGIYLVIWFGANEKVASRKKHNIKSALELKNSIEDTLPPELKGFIDVFVLDVSRA
jgi:tRNA A37 threonylcarbamoyladenosine biosynthesis protein TsaE